MDNPRTHNSPESPEIVRLPAVRRLGAELGGADRTTRSDSTVRCRTDGGSGGRDTEIESRGTSGCAMRQPTTGQPVNEKVKSMLYTIAVVLLILWVLGLVTSYTVGGFIHILLVVAIVMILVNIISGRRAL